MFHILDFLGSRSMHMGFFQVAIVKKGMFRVGKWAFPCC